MSRILFFIEYKLGIEILKWHNYAPNPISLTHLNRKTHQRDTIYIQRLSSVALLGDSLKE